MTIEQQILLSMADDNTRLALRFLEQPNVALALMHLKLAQTNLEQFQAARPAATTKEQPAIEV